MGVFDSTFSPHGNSITPRLSFHPFPSLPMAPCSRVQVINPCSHLLHPAISMHSSSARYLAFIHLALPLGSLQLPVTGTPVSFSQVAIIMLLLLCRCYKTKPNPIVAIFPTTAAHHLWTFLPYIYPRARYRNNNTFIPKYTLTCHHVSSIYPFLATSASATPPITFADPSWVASLRCYIPN